jgi:hypothetical protein
MANYTVSDLPRDIIHGEMVTIGDKVQVRFESNGEAKDVFLDDGFAPAIQLFPAQDYVFEAEGESFRLIAKFEDALTVEKT